MAVEMDIPDALLDHPLSTEDLLEYIRFFDPERPLEGDRTGPDMLVPLLTHCGYRTIRQVHEAVRAGWENFRRFETEHPNQSTFPASLAILYAILIADRGCREKIGTRHDEAELKEYYRDEG